MGLDISIEGLDELFDKLDGLSDKNLMQAAKPGMEKGLIEIRDTARELCPVNTGQMRQQIHTRTRMDGDELLGETVAGAEHSIYVEMGTGPKGEANHAGISPKAAAEVTYSTKGWTYPTEDGGFRYTNGQPARPFLYPAFKTKQGKALRHIKDAIGEAIER